MGPSYREIAMKNRILTLVQRNATWPAVLLLLALAVLLMFTMNGTHLPFSTPTIEEHSRGIPILDMRLTYTPDEVYELLEALGQGGRRAYTFLHLLPDLLFPFAYSMVFALTASWFLIRLFKADQGVQRLALLPLVSGAADLLENASIAVLALSYPSRIDWLANLASITTSIKFGLMPVGVVLLTAIAVIWFVKGRPGGNTADDGEYHDE